MDNYYHRTDSLQSILESGRLLPVSQLDPRSRREVASSQEALSDSIFLSKSVLPSRHYIVEKRLAPESSLEAPEASLGDRVRTLWNKLTKSASVSLRGSEDDIRSVLGPTATIVGSEGIGLALKRSSDRDILVPIRERTEYDALISRLDDGLEGLKASPWNHLKRDGYRVYSSGDIDVAVVHGGKAQQLADHVRSIRGILDADPRLHRQLMRRKERASNAWVMRDYRYKRAKRAIDDQLGITRFHETT